MTSSNVFYNIHICNIVLNFSGVATIHDIQGQSQYVYRMNYPKRGMAIVINNRIFERKTGMNERTGTDVDAASLYQLFKDLGFEAHIFNNQNCTQMLKILDEGKKLCTTTGSTVSYKLLPVSKGTLPII